MRRHLINAVCGALDYASYPLGMLLVAPIVLHRIGTSEYGMWIMATAIISTGGIIASGFCDAGIQRVAQLRATNHGQDIADTIRSIMGINLVLGTVMSVLTWMAAAWLAPRIPGEPLTVAREHVAAIHIASAAILLRAVETVGVSTLRAFEEYRATVQISILTRLLTLITAAVLALLRWGIVSILFATAGFLLVGACLQLWQVRRLPLKLSLWPKFHCSATRSLLGRGFFAWLQALGGAMFGQADRILLGASLGVGAVAPYALCVQFAQPIFGLTASGLHFVFPYLSTQTKNLDRRKYQRTLLQALLSNLLLVSTGVALLLVIGVRLIRLWAGPAVAHSAASILLPIVAGSAFMGLGVTGTYAMQALGLFRTVACVSLVGHSAMLIVMYVLLHHGGLRGLAFSRLGYGAVSLMIYLPLAAQLTRRTRNTAQVEGAPSSCELQEGQML